MKFEDVQDETLREIISKFIGEHKQDLVEGDFKTIYEDLATSKFRTGSDEAVLTSILVSSVGIDTILKNMGDSTADCQFFSVKDIKQVNIPSNIKILADDTFLDSDLEVVDLGSVTEIGQACFQNTKLKRVEIPSTVTKMVNYAFQKINTLEEVVIKGGVNIPSHAFSFCPNLKKVTIGPGTEIICINSFNECPKLEEVILSDTVNSIMPNAFKGCTSLKEISVPEAVDEIYAIKAFTDCEDVTIHAHKNKYDPMKYEYNKDDKVKIVYDL